ncbi:galactose-specific lectin nattectin-like [Anneissia japonica]|uniref:galactose-specific lectin nattectin-like n=1 Tax=Anneissia japonica TaxID=1529436 RepID=UPI00142592DF|nr:galactose-specific lectin nattectin-like [Anneissia japonica]
MKFLIFSCLIVAATANCPPLFTQYGKNCYRLIVQALPWTEAKMTCSGFMNCNGDPATLVSLQSRNDETFLKRLMGTVSKQNYAVWTSGNDIAEEEVFRWGDGSLFTYLNWAPEQPDNGQQSSGEIENCVTFFLRQKVPMWNDAMCELERPFVCMVPASLPQQRFDAGTF